VGKSCAGVYRYGFNGQEKDDELKGNGNSYDLGARLYDPRIGRTLSPDPEAAAYPMFSPYTGFGNNPISITDPDGKLLRDSDGNLIVVESGKTVTKDIIVGYTDASKCIKCFLNMLNLFAILVGIIIYLNYSKESNCQNFHEGVYIYMKSQNTQVLKYIARKLSKRK
jgi:RHS repeat-associated protein